jgi:hypothetical protein
MSQPDPSLMPDQPPPYLLDFYNAVVRIIHANSDPEIQRILFCLLADLEEVIFKFKPPNYAIAQAHPLLPSPLKD